MIRGMVESAQSFANKCCPLPDKYEQLTTSASSEDKKLNQRLEGFAYLYMLIWTFFQLVIFVALMVGFYLSRNNYFMTGKDCCTATEHLTRPNNDLPLKACSSLACQFDDYEIFSGTTALTDSRPRYPLNGDYSEVFTYEGGWVCYIYIYKSIICTICIICYCTQFRKKKIIYSVVLQFSSNFETML